VAELINDGPLRIAIDARPFSGPPCGYTVYLTSIISCLRAVDISLTLLSNRPLLPRYDEIADLPSQAFGTLADWKWEQTSLPDMLAEKRYDLYLVGANRGIPLRKCDATHYVLGLLDIIPYLFWRQYLWKPLRARSSRDWVVRETLSQLVALARADSILTISQQSAKDIKRVFHRTATAFPIKLPPHEKCVVPTPKPQFVYVGGVDHRKRVDSLLRAFALFVQRYPDHRLFLIGSNYASIRPLIEALGLADKVVVTGFVDNDTKYRLVSESIALVYPSLYEGYGLAIAEGFQAGTAVIAGPGGSQAEIGGDAVRLVDPTVPETIAAAMEEMLDMAQRARWIRRGQVQLERLTDPAIAQGVQDYVREKALMARRRRG
jgi:glycosyltransferase involved in cell wall biosynthesis